MVRWMYNSAKDVMTELDKLFASLRLCAFTLNRSTIMQRRKITKVSGCISLEFPIVLK